MVEKVSMKNELKGNIYARLDYIFVCDIFFRIAIIEMTFFQYTPSLGFARYCYPAELLYGYVIPIFTFPMWVLLLIILRENLPSIQRKVSNRKTTYLYSALNSVLPLVLAFIFSLLFIDSIHELIPRLPEKQHLSVIPSCYLTYILMLIYSSIRVFFAFHYYKFCYYTNKKI